MTGKDQNGLITILLVIIIAVLSVVVYSFLRVKAKQQGLELPF